MRFAPHAFRGAVAPVAASPSMRYLVAACLGGASGFLLSSLLQRRHRIVRYSGRRARAFARASARRARRRAYRVRGRARGMRHGAASRAAHAVPLHRADPPDDVTLAQRVRSNVLRRSGLSHGALNIDAHDGVVTLRGALPDPALAHRIETIAADIEGVRSVRNLIRTTDARRLGRLGDGA